MDFDLDYYKYKKYKQLYKNKVAGLPLEYGGYDYDSDSDSDLDSEYEYKYMIGSGKKKKKKKSPKKKKKKSPKKKKKSPEKKEESSPEKKKESPKKKSPKKKKESPKKEKESSKKKPEKETISEKILRRRLETEVRDLESELDTLLESHEDASIDDKKSFMEDTLKPICSKKYLKDHDLYDGMLSRKKEGRVKWREHCEVQDGIKPVYTQASLDNIDDGTEIGKDTLKYIPYKPRLETMLFNRYLCTGKCGTDKLRNKCTEKEIAIGKC